MPNHRLFGFVNTTDQNAHTPVNKRIRNVILATLITILVGILLHSLLSSVFFWIFWEVVGAVLVAYGCAGEWYWISWKVAPRRESFVLYSEFEEKKTKWEKLFAIVVAIGVAIEAIGLTHSIPEGLKLAGDVENLKSTNAVLFTIGQSAKESAARATEEAEKAKTEREKAESGRLELEKQVLALVEKTKARGISPNGRSALITNLKEVTKGDVEIVFFDKDPESISFAISIKRALAEAGFSISFSPRGVFRAVEMFPAAIDERIDLLFCIKDSASPPQYALTLLLCVKNDGIRAQGWPYNDSLSRDSLQIWVIPKIQPADK